MHERAGSFVNWEGRERPFDVVINQPNTMSDLRVLAALADGLGTDLGIRTTAQARAELAELGPWAGNRVHRSRDPGWLMPAWPRETTVVLATWRMALDASRALDNAPFLCRHPAPAGGPAESGNRRKRPASASAW